MAKRLALALGLAAFVLSAAPALAQGNSPEVTKCRASSRSIAVVIDPLVRSIRRASSRTGCGPLCMSASRMAKSERHMSSASMLRVA